MALTVEIIDFTRPITNCKNLFVTNIKTNELNEAQIMSALYEVCSPFGLLYEIQVFPVKSQTFKMPAKQTDQVALYYAFVKFYSYHAAQKAQVTLNNSFKLGIQFCKVCNAVRFKEAETEQTLFAAKCQELANYYLGFNGWTSAIRHLEEDKEDGRLEGPHVRFFCVVDLSFPRQGLSIQGIGAWEEKYSLQDPASEAVAMHKARKRSYQRALEHAFARVLLVVVTRSDGKIKITVEIDTTKPDELAEREQYRLAQEQVLMVNELTEEALGEDEESEGEGDGRKSHDPDDVSTMLEDVDDVNLHILQELGEGAT